MDLQNKARWERRRHHDRWFEDILRKYGVDYKEVFARVARMETIRLVIIVAAHHGWSILLVICHIYLLARGTNWRCFCWTATRIQNKRGRKKVYQLNRALYRLKQALRARNNRTERYFSVCGYTKWENEPTLFTKVNEKRITVESIFTGNDDVQEINDVRIRDDWHGKMKKFRVFEVTQKADSIFVCQNKHVTYLMERFEMGNSNSVCNRIVLKRRFSLVI